MKFKNKKVVIMGLGLLGGGVGTAKFFCRQGAKVLATDLKNKNQLKESIQKLKGLPIKYALGGHREKDFIKADLIIKNPGVPNNSPYLKVARKNKVPIKTDIDIFFDLSKSFIIGVTGTKGKSTVATLIYRFLKTKYPKAILAGNIGVSPLEILSKTGSKTKVVLELSSFELENLKKSPRMAVITNIYPDHLNRYRDMKEYLSAKENIFRYQKKKDILVLNYDDPLLRKISSSSRVYFFSQKKGDCFLKEGKIFFGRELVCEIYDLKMNNLSNVLAAILAAKLLKVSSSGIRKVLKSFKGVAYRQQFVGEKRGVRYFNDTTATMPEAVIEAIRTFKKKFPDSRLILIAGGEDKNLDYRELAKEIKEKVDIFILLPGTASEKIKRGLSFFDVKSMKEAVKKAVGLAQKGDIVLLSPGGASFNLFKNEFDRGEQFNQEVEKL